MNFSNIEEVASALESIGGSRWTKGSLDRIYFNTLRNLPVFSELGAKAASEVCQSRIYVDLDKDCCEAYEQNGFFVYGKTPFGETSNFVCEAVAEWINSQFELVKGA